MDTLTRTPKYSKPILTYSSAIIKGNRLLSNMRQKDGTPSQFLRQSDLEKWGWGCSKLPPSSVNPRHTKLIKAISPEPDPISQVHTSAVVQRFDMHEENVTVNGVHYPLTMGCFNSIMDPVFGVLIANYTASPAAMSDQHEETDPKIMTLPKLQHWSDVAFLQWQSLSNEGVMPELKYVVRSHISNKDCVRLLNSGILPRLREKLNRRASWLPAWPGVDFDMDSDEAKALLGTPNGSGVAWLLAQHKEDLGHKTVGKVTLWYVPSFASSDEPGIPNLLFHLKNVNREELEDGDITTA